MTTYLGKPQFEEDQPLLPALGLERALSAEIADGDFRTFVVICQTAWQEQPGALDPFTERSFAELAQLHPRRQRPTAETVRGRLYRLSKAGLVRRQRNGRTTWRTYPLLDGLRLPGPLPPASAHAGAARVRLHAAKPGAQGGGGDRRRASRAGG